MKKLFFLIALVTVIGCSETGLQFIVEDTESPFDDLLQIKGTVCTEPPTETDFPTKVMMIVDCSGSMQFTDPSSGTTSAEVDGTTSINCLNTCQNSGLANPAINCPVVCANPNNPGRQAAARKLIDRFKNNPSVQFSIIRFNGRITINGQTATDKINKPFLSGKDPNIEKAIEGLSQADITTDYQGALSAAYQAIEQDILNTSVDERIRTKYVLIFLSDGAPDPVCVAGCNNDKPAVGGMPVDNWCDSSRNDWCGQSQNGLVIGGELCDYMKTWYPYLTDPCKDYNQPYQIVALVKQILDLAKQYSVGEIRLHAAYLFVDGLSEDVRRLFNLGTTQTKVDPTTGQTVTYEPTEELLKEMAKAGQGVFRSFKDGQQIDFLAFNYTSLSRPSGMTNFLVTNINAWPNITRMMIDSDGDGIDDATEKSAQLNMDPLLTDSDKDGYSDRFEYNMRNLGFHPGDAKLPEMKCATIGVDTDGDGLLDCEEKIIGTDPKQPDTDRDRIPDGIEYYWGTNPSVNDLEKDPDFDNKFSDDEIRIHANPLVADPDIQAGFKYLYDVTQLADKPDGTKCYDFTVRQVRLVNTLPPKVGIAQQGMNQIMLYFGAGPADDPLDYGKFRLACVRPQYVPPHFKSPADGVCTVDNDSFKPINTFKAPDDCVTTLESGLCMPKPPETAGQATTTTP